MVDSGADAYATDRTLGLAAQLPNSKIHIVKRNFHMVREALGLEVGNIYEVAVFHAERHTTASNFRLTLSGFVTQTSQCDWVCGDGIVTAFEVCDDGEGNNTGGFGECNEDCLGYGPYCGDGVVDPDNEACDLGALNVGSYEGCNADCTPGPYCGDGVRDSEFEECDAGDNNGSPGAGCKEDCTTPPAG